MVGTGTCHSDIFLLFLSVSEPKHLTQKELFFLQKRNSSEGGQRARTKTSTTTTTEG